VTNVVAKVDLNVAASVSPGADETILIDAWSAVVNDGSTAQLGDIAVVAIVADDITGEVS
jgi:hypothetical protein